MNTNYKELPHHPPHCPNPECEHFLAPKEPFWFKTHGFHLTKTFGKVTRYRCRSCGRTFSTQTFSIDYYAKKKLNYKDLLMHLVTASGILDMSRFFQVRAETITNRLERLSRVALAVQSDLLKELPLYENLCADGFETFSYSQYYPCHINNFAGEVSEFIYSSGFANLRRKGRMTPEQKEQREALESVARADPKAVEKSFRILAEDLTQRYIKKGINRFLPRRMLYTDEHLAYPRAFRKVPDFEKVFIHETVSSKKYRNYWNRLFPVNYVDRQERKDLSDHARETVQFAHCPSAMMARNVVYRFYHNAISPRRVKESRKGDWRTHAEAAGIGRKRLWEIVETRWDSRPFWASVGLNAEEENTWFCRWRNPGRERGGYVPAYISV